MKMNKTVIITGSSRGIGKATALEFAKSQYNVVITYNTHEEEALFLFNEISKYTRADIVKLDLGNFEEVKKTAEKLSSMYPTIDVLVNNAGISGRDLFTEQEDDELCRMVNVNLTGTMLFTKEILKKMLRTESGSIVNVSSIWGRVGGSMEVVYSASKAGIIGFTKALSKEVAPMGIRVNAVAPGAIDTEMLTEVERVGLDDSIPLGRLGRPEEVAKSIKFLAESSFITGEILSVDGGGIY